MVFDSNKTGLRFEAPAEEPVADFQHPPPRWRGNPLAFAGAVLSFVPIAGLVLAGIGLARSRTREDAGRTAALIGLALSLVFGGVEAYIWSTAPLFDSGCLDADSSAARLHALQAAPGGNLTAISTELNTIYSALDGAAGKADDSQVRIKIQLVANDVKALSSDFVTAKASGDTSGLVADEVKLQLDGAAADSYCHSL